MTIEEAIAKHKSLSQVKSELAFKTINEVLRNHAIESDKKRSEEHLQYVAWLTELKQLREENFELKRLLRLAVEDFEIFRSLISGSVKCKWKHADEAEKLIGGKKK